MFVILNFILFALAGLLIWAAADVPLVFREIAYNTRKEGRSEPKYKMITILHVLLKIFACLIWISAIISIFGRFRIF